MTARASVAAVWIACMGCGGKLPDTRYYQIAPPDTKVRGGDGMLVLETLTTDAAYDDERIVYRTTPYRIDYYQYHRWSSAPGVMVGNYLEQAFETSGKFRAVMRDTTPDAPVILTGRVIAIEEIDRSDRRGAMVRATRGDRAAPETNPRGARSRAIGRDVAHRGTHRARDRRPHRSTSPHSCRAPCHCDRDPGNALSRPRRLPVVDVPSPSGLSMAGRSPEVRACRWATGKSETARRRDATPRRRARSRRLRAPDRARR
jgi:uncharacterized lipoprotein YmbA